MIGSINTLLVDEQTWTERIADALVREDDRFNIVSEASPNEGLRRLSEANIDCVVAAYDTPDMTGVEFLKAVREKYPELPFVILTETGSEKIASEAISAGVTDYYIKVADSVWTSVLANRLKSLVEAYRANQIIDAVQLDHRESRGQSGDIYFMFSGDWDELLYINSGYEQIWGGSMASLRREPKSFLEYVHPDDYEIAVESMEELSSGEPTDVEYRIQPPSGDQRWVRGVCEPVVDGSGTVTRIIGSVRDVTKLKERERRFRAVFEEAFDAMVIADDDGAYIEVNEAACELFGLDREDLLGRTVMEFAGEGFDAQSAWERFQDNDTERGRFPLRRPDGTVRTVEYAATSDFVPGEHLSVLRDITEQERQRRALEESQARYETLVEDALDTSSVGTFILDSNFEVVWVNKAIEEYFDIERNAVLGRDKERLIQTELKDGFADPDAFAERVIRTYHDNTYTEEFECRIRRADTGTWRWLHHWSQPITAGLYEGGRIEHYTDVTDTKERDKQLQVLGRVLRHNLHNKMNVVLGFAEVIATDASGREKSYAERIADTARDLLELTDKQRQIVDLITDDDDLQSVDLSQRVPNRIERLRDAYPRADISLQMPSDLQVCATPDVDDAVAELVENALVHSGGDSPSVAVVVTDRPGTVELSVTDNNDPIPDLEKAVLQGDVRVDQLTHSRGLGLWLVNWLVAKSGGTISFENTEGGNCIRVTLPK